MSQLLLQCIVTSWLPPTFSLPCLLHVCVLLLLQLSWSELNHKMMDPVEATRVRGTAEQQMVAIQNAADWEVDLAPGLLSQVVDLTPYVNSSAIKVSMPHPSRLVVGLSVPAQGFRVQNLLQVRVGQTAYSLRFGKDWIKPEARVKHGCSEPVAPATVALPAFCCKLIMC